MVTQKAQNRTTTALSSGLGAVGGLTESLARSKAWSPRPGTVRDRNTGPVPLQRVGTIADSAGRFASNVAAARVALHGRSSVRQMMP
mgnify:CR=1 FL=1